MLQIWILEYFCVLLETSLQFGYCDTWDAEVFANPIASTSCTMLAACYFHEYPSTSSYYHRALLALIYLWRSKSRSFPVGCCCIYRLISPFQSHVPRLSEHLFREVSFPSDLAYYFRASLLPSFCYPIYNIWIRHIWSCVSHPWYETSPRAFCWLQYL